MTTIAREDALFEVENLHVEYRTTLGTVYAVTDVSFSVHRGETLSIVGESGSGKSTLLKAMLRLEASAGGTVRYEDSDLLRLSDEEMRRKRPDLQLIMQDPIASLNPRRKVKDIVAEGLQVWPERVTSSIGQQVEEGLSTVSMTLDAVGDRRAGTFSGGQCQRIAIARALVLAPKVLFCDEPVSALDVSVQARVLNVIRDAKKDLDLTVLFVSHDLGVVKSISDRVMVMYLGRVCEIGTAADIFNSPAHPYTNLLLASAPGSNRPIPQDLTGETPSPLDPPSGCRFRTRCPMAQEKCVTERPELRELSDGTHVACHFPLRN